MTAAKIARLADRGVIRVSGADAAKLLGSLVTNDIAELETAPAMFAGLLTPQGKIIADFLIVREAAESFLLDVPLDQRAALAQKLKLYRLRSKAEIDTLETLTVSAVWDGEAPSAAVGIAVTDPRLAVLGRRVMASADLQPTAEPADYHAHRIALGVPEGGKDYDFSDTFPHEALLDQLNGVSFTKGCYVGQEIVSRMEHRGTARTRIVTVTSATSLPDSRPDVLMGEVPIGRLGSVSGAQGLALLRIDRAAEARAKGTALTIEGKPIEVAAPPYATFAL